MEFESWALLDAPRSYGPHEGLDFRADEGDGVLACLDGVVAVVGRKSTGYGNYVVIHHAGPWRTWYAHLQEISVMVSQNVKRGDRIGSAGDTGNSTGPHLHLTVQNSEIGADGYWLPDIVDPLKYL